MVQFAFRYCRLASTLPNNSLSRDSRDTSQPLLEYVESHNDDITELSFHPSNPSILLSGSIDGLVNLYDITITDEDDALIEVFNHGSSISHAGFLSDNEIYALSHDEIFSIYDTAGFHQDDAHESTHAFGDLRPQLQCEYIVDLVSSASTGFVLAAGSHRSALPFTLLIPLLTEPQRSICGSCEPPKSTKLVARYTRHPSSSWRSW